MNLFKKKAKLTTVKENSEQSITTINDLFARDDLNEFLADMNKEKPDIEIAIIIYVNKDSSFHAELTENVSLDRALAMLERCKYDVFKMFNEDDDAE